MTTQPADPREQFEAMIRSLSADPLTLYRDPDDGEYVMVGTQSAWIVFQKCYNLWNGDHEAMEAMRDHNQTAYRLGVDDGHAQAMLGVHEKLAAAQAEVERLRGALSKIASTEPGIGAPEESCEHPLCDTCDEMQVIASNALKEQAAKAAG